MTPLRIGAFLLLAGGFASFALSIVFGNIGPCGPADIPSAVFFFGGPPTLMLGIGLLLASTVGKASRH